MTLKRALYRAIPPAFRQTATDLKNSAWGGYRRHHYSQFGEDVVLGKLLRSTSGFYVDIGANHPKRYSNTYALYRRGWHGINIDPNTDAIRSFTMLRPRDISLALAIGDRAGHATLYRFSDPAYNTLSRDAAEALQEKAWLSPLPSEEVEIFTLAEVLTEHVPKGTTIDFMNIDVEGLDLAVLEGNDWSIFTPTVIAIEDHTFNAHKPGESSVFTFLEAKRYTLKAHVGPTLIFYHGT